MNSGDEWLVWALAVILSLSLSVTAVCLVATALHWALG